METKYLRMIQGMKKKGRMDWTVYILRCGDGLLNTRMAKDVQARIKSVDFSSKSSSRMGVYYALSYQDILKAYSKRNSVK